MGWVTPSSWFQPPQAPSRAQDAVYDPTTGLWVNKLTGAVTGDPAGTTSALTSSQQGARNNAIGNALFQRLGDYGRQYDTAQAGQTQLVNGLGAVISGIAPSVAQGQLQQGLGQIAAQQQSQASGVSGVNAALARQNAMQNTAEAQAATNQQGAMLRAGEVAGARAEQGQVLGAQANEANAASGVATGGVVGTGGLAAQNQKQAEGVAGEDLDFWTNAAKSGGSAIATIYGGKGSKGGT